MEFYKQFSSILATHTTQLITCLQRVRIAFSSCLLCGQQCKKISHLCQYCYQDLPAFNYPLCQGNLLNWPAIDKIITPCHFDHLICLAPYLWPFSTWINQYKYQYRFELSQLFTYLLTRQWLMLAANKFNETQDQPTLVLSVPIHFNRWKTRGFNQSHLIAKHFAKNLGITYNSTILQRVRDTEQQVGQSGKRRKRNMRDAFYLTPQKPHLPKHVILIDDVVTTGTTANEICNLLKRHGVEQVTVIAICLSLPNNN